MRIGEASGANGKASTQFSSGNDLLGNLRDSVNPDCGAYETVMFDD